MNKHLEELAGRRAILIAQTATQRMLLAQSIAPWRGPLALADHGLAAWRFIQCHPGLVLGGSLLLAARHPPQLGKWLQRGWVAWQIARKLRAR